MKTIHLCKLPDGECRLRLGRRGELPHELSQLRVEDAALKYLREIMDHIEDHITFQILIHVLSKAQ